MCTGVLVSNHHEGVRTNPCTGCPLRWANRTIWGLGKLLYPTCSAQTLQCFLLCAPGCQARSLPEDWESSWETAVGKVQDYFTDLNTKAEEMARDIKSYQISRELEWVLVWLSCPTSCMCVRHLQPLFCRSAAPWSRTACRNWPCTGRTCTPSWLPTPRMPRSVWPQTCSRWPTSCALTWPMPRSRWTSTARSCRVWWSRTLRTSGPEWPATPASLRNAWARTHRRSRSGWNAEQVVIIFSHVQGV